MPLIFSLNYYAEVGHYNPRVFAPRAIQGEEETFLFLSEVRISVMRVVFSSPCVECKTQV